MGKKRKIVLGALAVLLIFCLWYTRPRSFDKLAGDGEFQNFSMTAVTMGNKGGKMVSDSWQLDSYDGREEMIGAFKELLRSCKYRVSLRNLLPLPDSYSKQGNKDLLIIQLGAVLEDGSSFSAIYEGAAVTLLTDGSDVVAKAVDRELGDKLLAFVQEHGWKTNS